MRIGIDIGPLAVTNLRSGLYYNSLGLLTGLTALPTCPDVRLYLYNPTAEGISQARGVLDRYQIPFPVRVFRRVSGRPYGLRLAFEKMRSGITGLDLFHCQTAQDYPLSARQVLSFLVPDLAFVKMPQHHLSGVGASWSEYLSTALRSGDLIITFSEHTRSEICGTYGVEAERVVAIPLAASPHYRQLPPAEVKQKLRGWGLDYQQYLLTVCTLEPRKNHITLFRAYANYLQTRAGGEALPLVVAGPRGWMYEPILAEPVNLGIEKQVKFLGEVEGLEYLYNGARAFIYPSVYEGFGLPPLEAMACGTPTLVAKATSLPEVVGPAGLLFEPLDVPGLARLLGEVVVDSARLSALSAAGLARANEFSWRRTAEKHLEAFNHAAEKKWAAPISHPPLRNSPP